MKKILILNFTRLGDLIQTTPLLAGLKERYPGCEITLAANVSFMGICKNLPNIDRLVVFDPKQFIHADGGNTSILDVYRYLDAFTAQLEAEKYDVMVNLSHSDLSAVMGQMLNIPEVRGIQSNDEGHKVITDSWLMYFSGILSFRRFNTFNLVDIYQLGGGVVPASRRLLIDAEGPEEAGRRLLAELGVGPEETVIAVQAGASLKERRWPSVKFARSADILVEKWGGRVVLLGAPGERELVEEVAVAMKNPALNLAGKTSLEQLIGVVKRAKVIITNDTATMHIAASVKTPIVALFLVHAFAAETGPYCDRAVILEPIIPCFPCLHSSQCPHYACLDNVTPDMAAAAAEIAVSRVRPEDCIAEEPQFPGVKVSVPFFDKQGVWDIRPIIRRRATGEEVLGRVYRLMFARMFVKDIRTEYWKEYLERHFEPWDPREKAAWVEKTKRVFLKLGNHAEDGARLAASARNDLRKGAVDKIREKAQKFMDIDRAIEMLGLTHPECIPLVRLFTMGRANLPPSPPDSVMAGTKILYDALSESSRFVVAELSFF